MLAQQDTTTLRTHPDPLRVGTISLQRCDGIPFDSIRNGDSILGWEGDQQLQLYFNPQFRTWELWRMEANGEYACCCAWHAGTRPELGETSAFDITSKVITWIVTHDMFRRNVIQDLIKHNEAIDKDKARVHNEAIDEAVEAVCWGIKKDFGA